MKILRSIMKSLPASMVSGCADDTPRTGPGAGNGIIRRRMPEPTAATRPATGPPAPSPLTARNPAALREAQDFCARVARRHYENFPVASWFLPRTVRPAVQAIYAFARIADDFADEEVHEGRRMERLREWEEMLEACLRGEAIHPVFVALRDAIERFALPPEPFRDLLAAFRMDVEVRRYPDFGTLLQYCRLSANPIGRLVLHLFGRAEPIHVGRSNALCTALQLTNHWQDAAIDLGRDRIYLPRQDLERHGVGESDLRAGRVTDAWRALMTDLAARTRALYRASRPLCDDMRGRLCWELRLTWLGGMRVLDAIEAADWDVFRRRPRLGALDAVAIGAAALRWTR
jgi:phytoene synthase